MLCAVTMPWGWLCAFALRRRFFLAFLLSVCLASSGVFVGLFLVWLDVGISEFALFMVSGFLEIFFILEKCLHCSGWLFRLVLSCLEVWLVVATWM